MKRNIIKEHTNNLLKIRTPEETDDTKKGVTLLIYLNLF